METTKTLLNENEMPRQWYNLAADLPEPPLPPLGPDGKPISPDMLAAVFPMNLIELEVSTDRWIDIPEEILGYLRLWRPTPLVRARRLEKALGTPAKIFYKNEGVSPPGSHKPNTAIAQAYYNKKEGIKRISTETGAGQWGSSLALAGAFFGIGVGFLFGIGEILARHLPIGPFAAIAAPFYGGAGLLFGAGSALVSLFLPRRAARLGQNALKTFNERFTERVMKEKSWEVYRELLAAKGLL